MCGRLDDVRVRLGLLALCALLFPACGGGAAAGDVSEAPAASVTVLFQDGFEDGGASDQRWTPSQPGVAVDEETGTLPLDDGDVTTNAPPFERGQGTLSLEVAMAWPSWCPASSDPDHTRRPIQLVELDSGMVVASLVVTTAANCTQLLAEYRVDPTGTITPSSVVNPIVQQPEAFADGYHIYRIDVLADGRATWYRDGIAMIASFVPLSDRGYALRLEGLGIPGAPPIRFDEVEVVQR